ncbi:glutathione S-transferase family protein [Pseudoxanthomonas wuyuanensis]|uniref:Glutathione S-transferase n=1 Tax=Pseudoxanthomonas wuyuanensis TaxID=1073196 RepID=A0A286DBG1_9GAMM|nr:glutathione S-transferase family protein [Pseudoxanthomonas wuyuanensis]KAF1721739.1 glutathione S-transferase family protein [Pseudoxanthomonas wuyuanensis]SOD55996.1 glutathione S-transferase [Pseudoxanthomonas wuyuanensis]
MKLLFSRNPNPRLAVAAARYLQAPVAFEFAAPLAPGQAERYRPLNPCLRLPILVVPEGSLWEADAIACRLSRETGSPFWRTGAAEPAMIQWLSWGKENFVRACDIVQFEYVTKQRYTLGPVDPRKVDDGLAQFAASAALLDAQLATREWLLDDGLSYADFRMASFLPHHELAGLPLRDYPAIARWYGQLEALEAWRDPFQGLEAPELPPVPQAGQASPIQLR